MVRRLSLPRNAETACVLFVVLGAAVWLLCLAVPRSTAAFLALPGDRNYNWIAKARPVATGDLKILVRSYQLAALWAEAPVYRARIGKAEYLLAGREGNGSDDGRNEAAVRALTRALSFSPSDPDGWTWMARAEWRRSGASERTIAMLTTSILTGPTRPGLFRSRLALGFALWPKLNRRDRELVYQQVRHAWEASPWPVVEMTVDPARAAIVMVAFAREPQRLAEFIQMRNMHLARMKAAGEKPR